MSNMYVKFSRPVTWEGEQHEGIDLSGLAKMTVKDAIEVQKIGAKKDSTAVAVMPELSTLFMMLLASRAADMPIEFFQALPVRAAREVRKVVQSAIRLGNEDEEAEEDNAAVMKLTKTYAWRDERYTEIDLSGLAKLNTMNVIEAEERLIKEGTPVAETSYLYAALLASMATGKPEEFFTGMPLSEAGNLKAAVRNADEGFFE